MKFSLRWECPGRSVLTNGTRPKAKFIPQSIFPPEASDTRFLSAFTLRSRARDNYLFGLSGFLQLRFKSSGSWVYNTGYKILLRAPEQSAFFLPKAFPKNGKLLSLLDEIIDAIDLCHVSAILSQEIEKALYLHGEPRGKNKAGSANTKLSLKSTLWNCYNSSFFYCG